MGKDEIKFHILVYQSESYGAPPNSIYQLITKGQKTTLYKHSGFAKLLHVLVLGGKEVNSLTCKNTWSLIYLCLSNRRFGDIYSSFAPSACLSVCIYSFLFPYFVHRKFMPKTFDWLEFWLSYLIHLHFLQWRSIVFKSGGGGHPEKNFFYQAFN